MVDRMEFYLLYVHVRDKTEGFKQDPHVDSPEEELKLLFYKIVVSNPRPAM